MRVALTHRLGLAGLAVLLAAGPLTAQDSKSATLAGQLAAALDAGKLQNIAAKDPSGENRYVAALYFSGLQLIVVSGAYQAPTLLDDRLAKREYREVYVELNGASDPQSRVFVSDLGLNGLRREPGRDQPSDSYESAGKRTMFDGNWGNQQLTEATYDKIYAEADAKYIELLTALLAQAKAGS